MYFISRPQLLCLVENTWGLYDRSDMGTKSKTAFIFSQFPCYDETFILREMNQLKASGLPFMIYSLKTPKDQIIHEEARDLAKDTVYLPFVSPKIISINLYFLIRCPWRYLSSLAKVFAGNLKSPNFLIKTLAVWPKAVGFAWTARRQKITHVHGQWATYPATVAMIISHLNDIPFSFTGHAHDIHLDTTMLAEKIAAARFVLTCTEDNKRHLLSLSNGKFLGEDGRGKIIVSYHGVDLLRFRKPCAAPDVAQEINILSVGSLLECKGFEYLIEACRLLRDRGVDFRCTIAGGGPLEESLRRQIAESRLEDTVKLTGFITQDKLIPLYHQADIFVLPMVPGIHWGIPNVLIEAMAAGVPAVCTLLSSIPELIQDGKTGFIIPPKDPEAIAGMIVRLRGDEPLIRRVAEAGRRFVEEKFNAAQNAGRLKDLFLELYSPDFMKK